MDDIVHFMFRLEIDTGVVEILEDGAAHRRGGFGREAESFIHNLFRRDGCVRCQPMVARKNENQWVRTYARACRPSLPYGSSGRMKAASSLRLIKALASAGE